jgi:drug/metabolite transporter (DMT)-like permease
VLLLLQLRRHPVEMLAYFRQHWMLGFLGAAISTSAYGIVLWAMTKAPVSAVAALRESSVVFAVLISSLWFKEGRLKVGLVAAIGVATGVLLIKH